LLAEYLYYLTISGLYINNLSILGALREDSREPEENWIGFFNIEISVESGQRRDLVLFVVFGEYYKITFFWSISWLQIWQDL